MKSSEAETIFLTSQDEDGNMILSIGLSKAAWEYMKDGKTHTIDLTQLGANLKLLFFGCENKAAGLEKLKADAKAMGIEIKEGPVKNYGIKEKPLH